MSPMSPRLLRPRSSGFSPRSIANLGGWWDATDASSYTLDTGVSVWQDKSGLGQAFRQSSGTSQPTINATGINNRAALSFDSSNDWMDLESQTLGGNDLGFSAGSPFTLFIVHRYAGVVGAHLFAKASATSANRTLGVETRTDSTYGFRARGAQSGFNANGLAINANDVLTVQWSGAALTYSSRTRASTSLTVGTAAVEAENITLGARTASSPVGFYNGLVGEIIFFNSVLSAADKSRLSAYIQAKWGFALP